MVWRGNKSHLAGRRPTMGPKTKNQGLPKGPITKGQGPIYQGPRTKNHAARTEMVMMTLMMSMMVNMIMVVMMMMTMDDCDNIVSLCVFIYSSVIGSLVGSMTYDGPRTKNQGLPKGPRTTGQGPIYQGSRTRNQGGKDRDGDDDDADGENDGEHAYGDDDDDDDDADEDDDDDNDDDDADMDDDG